MKKILLTIIVLISLLTFTSCDTNSEEKFMIKGNIENTQVIDIDGQ